MAWYCLRRTKQGRTLGRRAWAASPGSAALSESISPLTHFSVSAYSHTPQRRDSPTTT
jgi:hypothetical protein